MHLIGADDVRSGGNSIRHGAEDIKSAASTILDACHQFEQAANNLSIALDRHREAMESVSFEEPPEPEPDKMGQFMGYLFVSVLTIVYAILCYFGITP